MNLLRTHKKFVYTFLPVLVLLGVAILLRVLNLGYSDFQGDEIKALFLPESGQAISNFLLTQRKGPIQFLITYLLKLLDPNYSNQFLVRFPFAIAGVLSVYYFYKLIEAEFGRSVGFFSAFFLATNGFFVAFSRIVQYQSFVILFMILALYNFSLASTKKGYDYKGIYLGFIFWALSILSHYDGVFIFPFVLYFLLKWSAHQVFDIKSFARRFQLTTGLKHLFIAGLIFVILLGIFYVPFVLNIDSGTKDYWSGRLSGTGGKISSSYYLFTVYQPIYVIHIYTILFVFGIVNIIKYFVGFEFFVSLLKFKLKSLLTIGIVALTPAFHKFAAVLVWFLIPLVFFELIVNIPGTHIYTYLLPMFIIMALGINLIRDLITLLFGVLPQKVLTTVGVGVVFTFIFLQTFVVFVDHAQEYPWQSEKFLVWEFPQPSPIYHLSMFGFPYYRDWEGVGNFVNNEDALIPCPVNKPEIEECPFKLGKIRYYSTNERKSISRYHIPFNKDTDSAGYYVYIRNPQSFTNEILSKKADYWAKNYEPAYEFRRCPEDISTGNFSDIFGFGESTCDSERVDATKVYYMVKGELDHINSLGF